MGRRTQTDVERRRDETLKRDADVLEAGLDFLECLLERKGTAQKEFGKELIPAVADAVTLKTLTVLNAVNYRSHLGQPIGDGSGPKLQQTQWVKVTNYRKQQDKKSLKRAKEVGRIALARKQLVVT